MPKKAINRPIPVGVRVLKPGAGETSVIPFTMAGGVPWIQAYYKNDLPGEFPVVGKSPQNYNRHLVKRSFFLAFGLSIAVLALAGRAFAEGAYQRTDDRKKTIVWNNDPQPGDTAEWKGGRDSEGYAEGPGTLTWLRTQKSFATGSSIATNKKVVPISRLTGTMTHGKFVGAVTTIDHGKTYHAKYVDGQRKGNWSLGPVVAKATSAEPAAAEPERPKKPAQPKIAAVEKVETPSEAKVSEE